MENRIIDLCFALDFWVFGGYVRDVMICGKREFTDIDICVPNFKHNSVDNFLNALSVFYTIDVTRDSKIPDMKYGAMSPGIRAVVHVTVNSQLKLDLVLFDGNLTDWRNEHSVDLSCNLFYTSRETPLGLRYVPKKYRYLAAPARQLIDMTRNGILEVVYETRYDQDASYAKINAECRKAHYVMTRAIRLIRRGWFLKGDLMTKDMEKLSLHEFPEWLVPPKWNTRFRLCCETAESIQKDAQADATQLPQNIRDQVRCKLNF